MAKMTSKVKADDPNFPCSSKLSQYACLVQIGVFQLKSVRTDRRTDSETDRCSHGQGQYLFGLKGQGVKMPLIMPTYRAIKTCIFWERIIRAWSDRFQLQRQSWSPLAVWGSGVTEVFLFKWISLILVWNLVITWISRNAEIGDTDDESQYMLIGDADANHTLTHWPLEDFNLILDR